ncbi:MAG: DUF4157 domain-containing protein [Chitinophagaceae bacterium]
MLQQQIYSVHRAPVKKATAARLPCRLKATLEQVSGFCLDDVRVHYNSDKPASVQALAYAQGTDIYLSPGQERHLPHEAWHVVQQKQGRVAVTLTTAEGWAVNDDPALEAEADWMGRCILQVMNGEKTGLFVPGGHRHYCSNSSARTSPPVIQKAGLDRELAGPTVHRLEGGEIDLQSAIMDTLNPEVEKIEAMIKSEIHVLRLCSVELKTDNDIVRTEVVAPVLLVPQGLSYGYPLIKDNKMLQSAIAANVWNTLQLSGELNYIIENKLINEAWRVFVDVDFYHRRSPDAIGFHKDTIGRSLFVNLNYNNKAAIVGPEYIVNPPAVKEHDDHIRPKLPETFFKDILEARLKLGEPAEIKVAKVPPYGIVSWVDELAHHSTPFMGHRRLLGRQITEYISLRYKEYEKIYSLLQAGKSQALTFTGLKDMGLDDDAALYLLMESGQLAGPDQQFYTFRQWQDSKIYTDEQLSELFIKAAIITRENLDSQIKHIAELYRSLFEKLKSIPDNQIARADLAALLLPFDIDALFKNNPTIPDFASVNLAECEDHCDVSHDAKLHSIPILRRQMSRELLAKSLPPAAPGKRQFLRTWVQTIPKNLEAKYYNNPPVL